ncbi:MAG: hypothetical protein GY793_10890 [Proteobacteria bacterium]|nr:hypothetical protein [Pseudomonadota bacterium]
MNIFKNIVFISLTVGLMVFVSFTSAEVRSLSTQAREVIQEQENLNENIQVLEAELTYLTSPSRLEQIAGNLNLKTIDYNSTKPQLVSLRYAE